MKWLSALIFYAVVGIILGAASSFAYLSLMPRTSFARPVPKHEIVAQRASFVALGPPIAPAIAGQARTVAPPFLSGDEKSQLVQAYYDAINSGDLSTAYGLLSDSFHAYQSFSQFQQAYGATMHMTIRAVQDHPGRPTLGIVLIASERQGDSTVLNGYVGYLEFSYDGAKGRWFIDRRKLEKVPSDSLQPPPPVANVAQPKADAFATAAPAAETPAQTGGSGSETPMADAAQQPSCQTTTIKDISSDDLVITTSGGDAFRVVDSSNPPVGWAASDSIQVCDSSGSYTVIKGTTTIAVTRRE